ncbi:MAG: hypothetical protein ACP5UT_05275 [Bryobacteraceae bacterium]
MPVSRRAVLAMTALPLMPAAGCGEDGSALHVERIRLTSATPWAELARACRERGLHGPRRIVARPEPAWWPHTRELPPRWQAWLEFSGGHVLVAECRPGRAIVQERPERLGAVTHAVAAALLS